jgi:hypothetical protein
MQESPLMTRHLSIAVGVALIITGCGGGRSISEQTDSFPKCDVAQGAVIVEPYVCHVKVCKDDQPKWKKYVADVTARKSRAQGTEGGSQIQLYDAHQKMTRQLVTALNATGCFKMVEARKWMDDDVKAKNWRVTTDLDDMQAKMKTSRYNPIDTATHSKHRASEASLKITTAVREGNGSSSKKQFKLKADRDYGRKLSYQHMAEHDWDRKRDVDGFGETAMQDVAYEATLEAAVFITEKAAGPRIKQHVAPPGHQPRFADVPAEGETNSGASATR